MAKKALMLVESLQCHGRAVIGEGTPAVGTPLYVDARHSGNDAWRRAAYGGRGECQKAAERLQMEDLRHATNMAALMRFDFGLAVQRF